MTAETWDAVRRAVDIHAFLLAGQAPEASHAATLAAATRYARTAERAGYAGVWFAEHHFIPYGTCPSAVALAAYVLGATSKITVGTAAAILSNRHPVALGEEAVLLDEISGSRFALGVARGGPWVDLEVFGTSLDRYANGFAESLDLLLEWLSGREQIGAESTRFRFRPVTVVPRPRRPIPVLVAATSPATVALAAQRGLPLLMGMHVTNAEKTAMLAQYADTALRHGHDPSTAGHASAHLAHVEDDDRRAAAAIRKPLRQLLAGTRRYVRIDGSAPAHRDLDAYIEHLLAIGAVGSPETCRRRLQNAAAQTGVRHLLLMVEAAGEPDKVCRNIERLADELLRSTDDAAVRPLSSADSNRKAVVEQAVHQAD